MFEIIRADTRGQAENDWLTSRHSFSFGSYFDPDRMGVGPLRVLNEDHVRPGTGFPSHPHRDMEILTYVLEGRLEHRDSLGHGAQIEAGTFQFMRAGRGIVHSEWNPSAHEWLHLLQIWIEPDRRGLEPGYAEFRPDAQDASAAARMPIASGREEAPLRIQQDATLFRIRLARGEALELPIAAARQGYLHVARGAAHGGDLGALGAGDAVVWQEEALKLTAQDAFEALCFDLPQSGS